VHYLKPRGVLGESGCVSDATTCTNGERVVDASPSATADGSGGKFCSRNRETIPGYSRRAFLALASSSADFIGRIRFASSFASRKNPFVAGVRDAGFSSALRDSCESYRSRYHRRVVVSSRAAQRGAIAWPLFPFSSFYLRERTHFAADAGEIIQTRYLPPVKHRARVMSLLFIVFVANKHNRFRNCRLPE